MQSVSRRAVLGAFSASALCAAWPLHAQSYPSRTTRLVVPQAAGGMADSVARLLAQGVSQSSGQTMVVENRPGGGTMLGSDLVAKSAPDGYSLLLGTVSLAIVPAIDGTLAFDPNADLIPVTLIADVPNVLLAHKSVPASTLQELVAYAKKNPGKLTYASQGIGTTGHMAGELLKQAAGIDLTHVPYRGSAPAAQDLIAGHVHLLFDVLPLAIANLKNDNVKALAIAAPTRAPALPAVPTTAEAGLPTVQTSAWFGLFAPAKTPTAVVAWLHESAQKTFGAPDIRDRLNAQGALVPLLAPAAFKEFMAKDAERWKRVAELGKITAN